MTQINLTNETKRIIRKAIRERLQDCTEYMIRKVIKGELEDPASWWNPADDNEQDPQIAGIERYYRNINSPAYATNIYMSFKDRMANKYGIIL